ncbi:MAG: SBBP repeat-containing protein, partial [Ignavibacteria bacterium]|nr:SBBP repeat-containing protein [Ignavibacteria bacterium]
GGAYYQGSFGGGTWDVFILKFNDSGVRQWATFYGGNQVEFSTSILTDVTGNVYLTGESAGGTFPLLNPGGGAYYQGTFAGATDIFILKFNNMGIRQWATFYGGNNFENSLSVKTDLSGNIYLTGTTRSTSFPLLNPGGGAYFQGTHRGFGDAYILKFSNSGVRQWATFYGGTRNDEGYSIVTDSAGNVFVGGESDGDTTFPLFNPGGGAYYQGTDAGDGDAFILKFTNTGARVWATFYGGDQFDREARVSIGTSGNVFVTGLTSGGTFPLHNPGGGAYYQGTYGGGNFDIFILKFSNSGVRQWATFYGGNLDENCLSSCPDNTGNLYLTGTTKGGTFPLFNPGGGAYFQGTFGGGGDDAILLKFTNSGVRQWATYYGGNGTDVAHSIAIDIAGNLFITGYTRGGTFPLFNPGGGAYYQNNHGGQDDAFISKFGDLPVAIPINNELPAQFSISQNYPNPFNPVTKFKVGVSKLSNVRIVVYDITGKEVETIFNGELSPGTYEVTFDGSRYSSGVYFYRIIVEGEKHKFTKTMKMVLLK